MADGKMFGMDSAERYLSGNLEKPKDGYDGIGHGCSSLQNRACKKVNEDESPNSEKED